MTEQEKINVEVQTKLAVHDEKFDAFMREMQSFKEEMRDFKQEMRDFKQEMRDKDNQRHAEIAELRQKHDSEMKELNEKIDSKFDRLSSQIQNMAIAAVVGVGAIVWAVFSALR